MLEESVASQDLVINNFDFRFAFSKTTETKQEHQVKSRQARSPSHCCSITAVQCTAASMFITKIYR